MSPGSRLLGAAVIVLACTPLAELVLPDSSVIMIAVGFALLGLGAGGRLAWLAAACGAAYLVIFVIGPAPQLAVAAMVFSVPPFTMGTMLRRSREAETRLRQRLDELDAEKELYAQIAVRHERARIAGELHDLVGHALSVMVIQSAAGQRLAADDPERADAALLAIAAAARDGERDLRRLGDLLTGGAEPEGDLTLIDALVERSRVNGLDVRYRIAGQIDTLPLEAAHLAYRVVQESLTNALRYAPDNVVEVLVDAQDERVLIRVDDRGDSGVTAGPVPSGGRGLVGLRDRVTESGGRFTAGPTGASSWRVEAELPLPARRTPA